MSWYTYTPLQSRKMWEGLRGFRAPRYENYRPKPVYIGQPTSGSTAYAATLASADQIPIKSQSFNQDAAYQPKKFKRKVGNEGGFVKAFFQIFAMVFAYLFWAVTQLLIYWHVVALFLLPYFSLYVLRFYHGDLWCYFTDGYEIGAYFLNFIIDVVNNGIEEARPFIPVWNWYQYFQKIYWEVFWAVIDPDLMVRLLEIMIDVVWDIMPALVKMTIAIVPVIVTLVPYLADIVNTLFVMFLPVFLDLVELFAQLVVAIVPILPPLVEIFSLFISIVITEFLEIFPLFMEMILFFIETVIPFLTTLITRIATIFTNVADEIANNGLGGGSGGLGQFFDFLFLVVLASVQLIADLVIVFFEMIVDLVTNNFARIMAFVEILIQTIAAFIVPFVTLLIQVVTGTVSSVISDVVEVLLQAFIDMAPVIIDVFEELITSGLIEDLIAAIVAGFATGNSPAFLNTFSEVVKDLIIRAANLWIAAIETAIQIWIIFLPLTLDIVILVLNSGIVQTLIEKIMEFLIAIVDPFVEVLLVLFVDVIIGIVIGIVFEYIIDLAIALMEGVLTLILLIPLGDLVALIAELMRMVVVAVPELILVLVQIIQTAAFVIGQVFDALALFLISLFVNNDFTVVIFNLIFTIVAKIVEFLFGVDITIVQFLIDLIFRLIMPFFDAILLIVGATMRSLSPAVSSAAEIVAAIAVILPAVLDFIGLLISMLGDVLQLFQMFGFIFGVFDTIYPLVEFILKPALILYENVVKPALCPIDAPCCYLFVDFGSCVFPGFGNCCCNDDNGCPPQGCSCIFT